MALSRSVVITSCLFGSLSSSLIGVKAQAQPAAQTVSNAATEFMQLYDSGQYRAALKPGALAISQDPSNHAMRLKLANALAWTGRYEAALEQYEKLQSGELDSSAKVGIANILRWRGAPQVALPILQDLVKREASNKDAQESLRQTQREILPMATVKLGWSNDSNGLTRKELSVSQRYWQSESFLGRPVRWDVGAVLGRDTRPAQIGATSIDHRELQLSFAAPAMGTGNRAVQQWGFNAGTRFELSLQNDLKSRIFGRAHLDLLGDAVSFRVGHVNWGRQVFNQSALAAGLTANQVGASGSIDTSWLLAKARLDYYATSDGNRVIDGDLTMNPTWQPLPWGVQWYKVYAFRDAARPDSRYWSPRNYLTSSYGLKRSWYGENSEFTAAAAKSFGLTRDAANGYNLSGSGKYWISKETALGLDFFAIDAPQVGAYRYRYLGLTVNQLW